MTQKDNFVVEEVLSEEDEPEKHKPTKSGTVTIEEVLEEDIDDGKLPVLRRIFYTILLNSRLYMTSGKLGICLRNLFL